LQSKAPYVAALVILALVIWGGAQLYSSYNDADLVNRIAVRFPATDFVDVCESHYFTVYATVYLLEPGYTVWSEEEPDYSVQHLVYSITAENKTSEALRGVVMDVRLADSAVRYMSCPFAYFSSMDPVDISPGKALHSRRWTLVPNLSVYGAADREEAMKSILGPIQVVLRWEGKEERLLVGPDQIELRKEPPSGSAP